jgi:Lysine-specific metallo-endopeptidase
MPSSSIYLPHCTSARYWLVVAAASAGICSLGFGTVLAIGIVVGAVMLLTGASAKVHEFAQWAGNKMFPPGIEANISTGSKNVSINSKRAARAAFIMTPVTVEASEPPEAPDISLLDSMSQILSEMWRPTIATAAPGTTPVDYDRILCKKHPSPILPNVIDTTVAGADMGAESKMMAKAEDGGGSAGPLSSFNTPAPAPVFTDDQKKAIESSLIEQKKILEAKKAELARWNADDQAKFKKAFGTDSEDARKNIQGRIDRMLELNKNTTVANFKPAEVESLKKAFAYVYSDDSKHTIYLGEQYWTSPNTGADSKAGVLTHEMSHFNDIGKTDDSFDGYNKGKTIYGVENSRNLASVRSDLALQHADSFEYYVED